VQVECSDIKVGVVVDGRISESSSTPLLISLSTFIISFIIAIMLVAVIPVYGAVMLMTGHVVSGGLDPGCDDIVSKSTCEVRNTDDLSLRELGYRL
jgi:hypothetical protein